MMEPCDIAILSRAIFQFGRDTQLKMAIEKMAALTEAICKYWSNETTENISTIAEELADVAIVLEQLKIMFCLDCSVNAWQHTKLQRLQAYLDMLESDNGGESGVPRQVDECQ